MTKKGQEPAFPLVTKEWIAGFSDKQPSTYYGMSKRYWTVVMMAQGLFHENTEMTVTSIAELSFKMADALLEEEEK